MHETKSGGLCRGRDALQIKAFRALGFMPLVAAMASCDDDKPYVAPLEPSLEPLRARPVASKDVMPGAASMQAPQPPVFGTGKGCKDGMAHIKGFCIDRFEIHLVYRETRDAYPYFMKPPQNMQNLIAVSEPNVFPQGYMSQNMAKAACEASGKRLCTLDEWTSACRGPANTKFPYGPINMEGVCNVNRVDPYILNKYFPNIPHLKRAGGEFNDPRLLQDPNYLQLTGGSVACVTPDGLFDMDGNLSEWVAETVQKGDGLHGTFAGNAFHGYWGTGCTRSTTAHFTEYRDYSLGTRCCTDPK